MTLLVYLLLPIWQSVWLLEDSHVDIFAESNTNKQRDNKIRSFIPIATNLTPYYKTEKKIYTSFYEWLILRTEFTKRYGLENIWFDLMSEKYQARQVFNMKLYLKIMA